MGVDTHDDMKCQQIYRQTYRQTRRHEHADKRADKFKVVAGSSCGAGVQRDADKRPLSSSWLPLSRHSAVYRENIIQHLMVPSTSISTISHRSWNLMWKRPPYDETKWMPGQEPRKRRLLVVACLASFQWHITLTFEGWLHSDGAARANEQNRREDLQDLCQSLDFNRLQLLDNTVTELVIKR
jgi:hypothetical protein